MSFEVCLVSYSRNFHFDSDDEQECITSFIKQRYACTIDYSCGPQIEYHTRVSWSIRRMKLLNPAFFARHKEAIERRLTQLERQVDGITGRDGYRQLMVEAEKQGFKQMREAIAADIVPLEEADREYLDGIFPLVFGSRTAVVEHPSR